MEEHGQGLPSLLQVKRTLTDAPPPLFAFIERPQVNVVRGGDPLRVWLYVSKKWIPVETECVEISLCSF
jgi:hypothetical protein